MWHSFCGSTQNVFVYLVRTRSWAGISKNPPLCFVNFIVPIITLLVLRPYKTKFTKCQEKHDSCQEKCNLFTVFHLCSGGRVVYCFLCVFSLAAFTACPQGTFKSSQGAGLCQQCPLNSRSTIEAATLCGCRNGYYRGDMDRPEDVCTSESVFFSLCQTNTYTNKQKYISNKPFSSVAECSYASGWPIQPCENRSLDWSYQ